MLLLLLVTVKMGQNSERFVRLLGMLVVLRVKGLALVLVEALLRLEFDQVNLLMVRIMIMVVVVVLMLEATNLVTLMTFLLAYYLEWRLKSIHHYHSCIYNNNS